MAGEADLVTVGEVETREDARPLARPHRGLPGPRRPDRPVRRHPGLRRALQGPDPEITRKV